MANFVRSCGLHKALANHDWAAFAQGYNGPSYAKNQYDTLLAANFQKFTYGPVFRYFRKRNIDKKFDIEPEWRRRGRSLTTGYQPRW